MLSNTTAPDGNKINENGAWILNGVVQTQNQQEKVSYKENLSGSWTIDSEKTNASNNLSLRDAFGS